MSGAGVGGARPFFQLRLFIAGNTTRSRRAIENLRAFCETDLAGRFDLEVVDIYQQPVLAELSEVVAVPTLLRVRPLPERRIVGDLSEIDRLRQGLGLPDGADGWPSP